MEMEKMEKIETIYNTFVNGNKTDAKDLILEFGKEDFFLSLEKYLQYHGYLDWTQRWFEITANFFWLTQP